MDNLSAVKPSPGLKAEASVLTNSLLSAAVANAADKVKQPSRTNFRINPPADLNLWVKAEATKKVVAAGKSWNKVRSI